MGFFSGVRWTMLSVAAAVIVAIISYFFVEKDTIHSTTLAFLTIFIGIQLDQAGRTQDAVEKSRRYGALGQKLEQSRWAERFIEEIIEAAANISTRSNNKTLMKKACDNLADWAEILKELGHGRSDIANDEFQQEITLAIEGARSTIRAVSVSNPHTGFGWWKDSDGDPYWRANKKVSTRMRHPVKTERNFVYRSEQEKLESPLRDIIQSQRSAHVKVYTADANKVPPNLLTDMAIIDEKFLYETRLNASGGIDHFHCSQLDIDISHSITHFETLKKRYAHEYDPDEDGMPPVETEGGVVTTGDTESSIEIAFVDVNNAASISDLEGDIAQLSETKNIVVVEGRDGQAIKPTIINLELEELLSGAEKIIVIKGQDVQELPKDEGQPPTTETEQQ